MKGEYSLKNVKIMNDMEFFWASVFIFMARIDYSMTSVISFKTKLKVTMIIAAHKYMV